MPDAPADTSNAIGGVRIVQALTRDAAWQGRLKRAFGSEKSWSRIGGAAADMSELYGLRFHDANGWVDVVVLTRSSWVSVSESGARSSAYVWNVNRGPAGALVRVTRAPLTRGAAPELSCLPNSARRIRLSASTGLKPPTFDSASPARRRVRSQDVEAPE